MAGVEHSKDHQIRWDKDNATSILVYDQSELLPQIAEELGTARQLQFYNNSLFRNYVFDADQECEFTASVGQHFYQIGGTIRCIIAARNRNYRIFLEYCPFEEQKEYYGIFATINGL